MPRVLVTGAAGLLGPYVVSELEARGVSVLAPRRAELDITDDAKVESFFASARPDTVIHAAALAAIADCSSDPVAARAVNAFGTRNIARACRAFGARMVHVSTDQIFDGEDAPYAENAIARPLSVYGTTKIEAESEARVLEDAIVVRLALLFGPSRSARRSFFDAQREALESGARLVLFDDEWRTPISLPAAAEAIAAVAQSPLRGILHVAGPERMSRLEMGERLARALGRAGAPIARASRTNLRGEPRPRDLSLDVSLFRRSFPSVVLASFEDECARMLGGRPLG